MNVLFSMVLFFLLSSNQLLTRQVGHFKASLCFLCSSQLLFCYNLHCNIEIMICYHSKQVLLCTYCKHGVVQDVEIIQIYLVSSAASYICRTCIVKQDLILLVLHQFQEQRPTCNYTSCRTYSHKKDFVKYIFEFFLIQICCIF